MNNKKDLSLPVIVSYIDMSAFDSYTEKNAAAAAAVQNTVRKYAAFYGVQDALDDNVEYAIEHWSKLYAASSSQNTYQSGPNSNWTPLDKYNLARLVRHGVYHYRWHKSHRIRTLPTKARRAEVRSALRWVWHICFERA